MPYISEQERKAVRDAIALDSVLPGIGGLTAGQLNYVITKVIDEWARARGGKYADKSAVRGVLLDVLDEFYHKVVRPYEDEKCTQNGEVYGDTEK